MRGWTDVVLGRYTAPNKRSDAVAISAKSIAVLPFENLSEEKSNAYFADAIQDEIITRLANVGDLKVIARSSTERYKAKPEVLRACAVVVVVTTASRSTRWQRAKYLAVEAKNC